MFDFINRNLLVLFYCQVAFVSGSMTFVTVGGIVGFGLAPDPSLATLPVAIFVIGTALATIPAAFTMQRIGRRRGFMLATLLAACGAWLVTAALGAADYWMFCAANGVFGASLGFSQQFRFAAAESVALDKVSHAISFILLGSIVGAFVGPELVAQSAAASAQQPYELVFKLLIGVYLVSAVVLLLLRDADVTPTAAAQTGDARSFTTVLRQPLFITAVLAGVVGQGVMTFVMTATPISMNVADGFSIQATSEVIRAHVIAMYLPSLVTPWLVSRVGLSRMMFVGIAAMGATLVIGLAGHQMMHYWFALVMLGVGWNFLFVSGTTLLVTTYQPHERFKSQAFNDFSIFGASALASLLAGSVLYALGWTTLLLSAIPALVLMAVVLWWSTFLPRLN